MSQSAFSAFHLLNGHGGGATLSRANLEAGIDDRPGTLWLRFDLREPDDQRWIQSAGLPDFAVETLLAEDTRPRFVATGAGMLIVLRGVNLNPGAETDDMIAIRIWLERDRIITCQRRSLRSVEDIARALAEGRGPISPGDLLLALIERLAEYIEAVLEGLADEIEAVEDDVEGDRGLTQRPGLSVLRRKAARIRRFLQPQREALDRLCRHAQPWLEAEQVDHTREYQDSLLRQLEDLELLRERAQLVHEELKSRIAEVQSSRIYVLSIVTAIFLPLTFITGLFGMNVAGLPGTADTRAFLMVCLGCAIVAVGLAALLRLKKWF